MDIAIQRLNDAPGPALRRYLRTRSAYRSQSFRCARLVGATVVPSAFHVPEAGATALAAVARAARRMALLISTGLKARASAPGCFFFVIPGHVPRRAWAVASAALGP